MAKSNDRDALFWIATSLVAIVIVATVFLIGYIIGSSETIEIPEIADVEVSIDDDTHFIGDEDAPVTMVEYSDFKCPFCARHHRETYPKIVSEYVETGKVKLVFKDLPLYAMEAAIAVECSYDQGGNEMYFEFKDLVYDKQSANAGEPVKANLLTWASEIEGLDVDELEQCIDNNESIDRVESDRNEAVSFGFNGTPSFVINGQPVVGALPYEDFKKVIESKL